MVLTFRFLLDGHYLLVGQRTRYGDLTQPSTDWGGWLYKFSAQGDSIWSRADNVPPGITSTGAFGYAAAGVLSSGSIIASGEGNIDNKYVGWVVKVSPDGCLDTLFCHTVGVHDLAFQGTIEIFPNPANQSITIERMNPESESQIQIIDLGLGRILKTAWLRAGEKSTTFDVSNLPNGVYSLVVLNKETTLQRFKLIIAH